MHTKNVLFKTQILQKKKKTVKNLQSDINIESTIVRRQIGITVSEFIFPALSNRNTGNYRVKYINFGEQSACHRFMYRFNPKQP